MRSFVCFVILTQMSSKINVQRQTAAPLQLSGIRQAIIRQLTERPTSHE